MKLLLFFIFSFFLGNTSHGQIVIPSPESVLKKEGTCSLKGRVIIDADDKQAAYLSILQNELLLPLTKPVFVRDEKADIRFIQDGSMKTEAYRLQITPCQIVIYACDQQGFLYAVQTLKQWVVIHKRGLNFACVEITDTPRVAWRSFMLDSGRQFQQISTIKKYINMAAMLKMNYFHWHLTEGLGWRVEIKRYPQLTAKGAFVGKGAEQQGFYTQNEIKDVIKYAAERGVTIVPEIDMPGHAEAALVAYPQLGCFGDSVKVPETGFTHHIFCAGKETTRSFLKNVLDEVCDLFPSTYIHLGGDEAPKENWDKCSDCQKIVKDKGLKNSSELQQWFSYEMADYLKKKGRQTIFWGDVVYQDGHQLPDNVVIHWWNWRGHRDKALKAAIKGNHMVICGTNNCTYLNFPLSPWKGYGKDRTFDMRDVYTNNPAYLKNENPLIKGMSCALWTDYGVTEKSIDKRLFPRILALAEQMWHKGELMEFDLFKANVEQKKDWFEQQGYIFGPTLKEDVEKEYNWD